jgi:hypothetical protein
MILWKNIEMRGKGRVSDMNEGERWSTAENTIKD